MVKKGEIKKRGRTYCVAGAPTDVRYSNNTRILGISIHYFPKDAAVWPKWTRFDRWYRGDFPLHSYRPFVLSRPRGLRTHVTGQAGGRWPTNSTKKNADSGACSHSVHDCSSFCLADISQAKNGEIQIVVSVSRTWDALIILVFPRDLHLHFSYRMKILPIVVSIVFL